MSLDTYAGLKASIASWINRTDLTTQIPDFVSLAEEMINQDLETRVQETTVTGTLTGETLAQPADLNTIRRFTVAGYEYSYVTPAQYSKLSINQSTAPRFTVIGSTIYVLGAPTSDYVLVYEGNFVLLSADGDTNWVLTNKPSVYLNGSLYWAAVYMKDVNAATGYKSLYDNAIAAVNSQEKAAKTGGPLTMRAENRE